MFCWVDLGIPLLCHEDIVLTGSTSLIAGTDCTARCGVDL